MSSQKSPMGERRALEPSDCSFETLSWRFRLGARRADACFQMTCPDEGETAAVARPALGGMKMRRATRFPDWIDRSIRDEAGLVR